MLKAELPDQPALQGRLGLLHRGRRRALGQQLFGRTQDVAPERGGSQVVRRRQFDQSNVTYAKRGIPQLLDQASREEKDVVVCSHAEMNAIASSLFRQVRCGSAGAAWLGRRGGRVHRGERVQRSEPGPRRPGRSDRS